jgi:predicted phage terminase large subunit-like protein
MATAEVVLPTPLPHQRPVLLHPARYKVVVTGRRWGKTTLGLLACLEGHGAHAGQWPGALQGAQIWWCAPTYPMASAIWRDLKFATKRAWVAKSELERRIDLPGGGSVTVRSTDNPDTLRGVGLDGVVLDEAAMMDERAWTEVLRPTLADRQGWALFLSTPKGQNWYWRLFEQAGQQPEWARWQAPTAENPLIPPDELAAAEREQGPWVFRQEFRAEFIEPGGMLFPRAAFRYAEATPDAWRLLTPEGGRLVPLDACQRFITVDLAVTLTAQSDWTVYAVWWLTPQRDLVLGDLVRVRVEGPDHLPLLQQLVARWHPHWIGIEHTQYQLALIQAALRAGLPVRELRADRDKWARAQPAAARVAAGTVYWRADAPWVGAWEDELLSFPHGPHDDQVDCLAYAALAIQAELGLMETLRGYYARQREARA